MTNYHEPVMLEQVIRFLDPAPDRIYLDGTLGTGGHAEALLERSAPSGRVFGVDTDAETMEIARQRLARFGERMVFIHARYDEAGQVLPGYGVARVHGVLLDLGLSRVQLEMPGRGFSFSGEDPLDMRMDRSRGESAAQLLDRMSEDEMARLLHTHGEERRARRVARAIVTTKKIRGALKTTRDLEQTVWHALPRRLRQRPARIHPATRTFMALRIAVNHELECLQAFLKDLPELLHAEGRCCVISFHSLEDRIVKHQFRAWEGEGFRVLTRKVVRPEPEEVRKNRLSRSARLRAVERL